ncbi:hypothetical protein CLOM_g9575 [Closterium sp. NIES-68]|nr:hypothetical protein CLOM_g21023 [Closterium sp. NIES-68]GJP50436.1 hypothetical protein CLOM_g9575 [Closterium sp. NIES-68]
MHGAQSAQVRAVWHCEDVLAQLWASGAFDDAKSIVDTVVLTDVGAVRRALAAVSDLSAEEARRLVSQHLAPAGTDLHSFTPPDFHPHPPSFLPHVTHPATRLWALAVHRLWPRLSFRTAPPPATPAMPSHPSPTLPSAPSAQAPRGDPVHNSGGEGGGDSGPVPRMQQQEKRGGGGGGAADSGVVVQGGSLLALPHAPVIVPGERFREMYYWDSYWVIRGLLVSGMLDSALAAVRNLLHLARAHGHVPNGSRAYYLNRSQPPLLSHMVRAVHAALLDACAQGEQAKQGGQGRAAVAGEEGPADAADGPAGTGRGEQAERLVREALPVLVREHEFWTQAPHGIAVYHPPSARTFHLSRYYAMWTRPRPESFPQDTETAALALQRSRHHLRHVHHSCPAASPPAALLERAALFRELATVAESGWDFSSRWMRDPKDLTSSHPSSVLPADLNALLFHLERTIAALAHSLLSTPSPRPPATPAATAEGPEGVAISDMSLAELAARFAELAERRREAMDVMMWREGVGAEGGGHGGGGEAGREEGRGGGGVREGRWRDVWVEPRGMGGADGAAAAQCGSHCEWVAVQRPLASSTCASTEGSSPAPSEDVYASDYFPLCCGLVPAGDPRIDLVVASLQSSSLLLPAGVATSTRFTGQQWDYPNVWPPLHHAICDGLLLTASPHAVSLARQLAHRFLASARAAFERTGAMHEKYDGRHRGAVGGGGEYNPQVGFGWTNGAVLSLLDLFGYEEP